MKILNKLSAAFLCAALLAGLCLTQASAKTGDVAGNYYSTDIKTYLYYSPITSYNIGGKTVIDAEILNWHYGFDVYWYADTRRLEITDKGGEFNSLQAESGELCQSTGGVPGAVAGQYYETDIVTTLNGKEIESYNIGGRTCIVAEAMRDFGYIVDLKPDTRTLLIRKSADFYKIQTDYGTIKTMYNGTPSYREYVKESRGILLRDKNNTVSELATPSGTILLDNGIASFVKLSDVCAALKATCTLQEKVVTNHINQPNGISYDQPQYSYSFDFSFDRNAVPPVKPAPTEYPRELVNVGPCYGSSDVTMNVNGEKAPLVQWFPGHMGAPGRDVVLGILIVNGEAYMPTYTVAKMLGYASAS